MSCYKGMCYYPHGGYATAALILASGAGLAATGYAALSCRFLKLTYDDSSASTSSTTGCFEEAFLPDITGRTDDGASSSVPCQVGIGLYQWLQQSTSTSTSTGPDAWTKGSCVGYQATMLSQITDLSFSLSRGFGVFAVLMSVVVLCWNLMLACVELNWIQVYLRRLCSFLLVISCGLSFLLERSDVCTSQFPGSTCALDQGAMAMIAASLLWFCDLIMTSVWIKSDRIYKPSIGRQRRRHPVGDRDDSTDRDDEDEELARKARYASAVQVFHPNDKHLQRISPTASGNHRAERISSTYPENLPPPSMSSVNSPSEASVAASAVSRSESAAAAAAATASARNTGDGDKPLSARSRLLGIPTSFSYASRTHDESAGASPPSRKSGNGSWRQRNRPTQEPEVTSDTEPESAMNNVTVVDDTSTSKEQLEVILDNIERHMSGKGK